MLSRKKDLAFIATGGGMSCAYSAGVALALQDMGLLPSIFIGSSGSAGTLSYFAAGQAERAVELWKEEVSQGWVISRSSSFSLNVDRIVNTMRDFYPFDTGILSRPEVFLSLAVTNNLTGGLAYFNTREHLRAWYEVVRASMAIPLFYGKHVFIEGKEYLDGDVTATMSDHVALAKTSGARIAIVCRTNQFLPAGVLGRVVKHVFLDRNLSRSVVTWAKNFVPRTRDQTLRIIHIRPRKRLPTGILNNSRTAIVESIRIGYDDTMRNSEILSIVEAPTRS